MLSLIESLQIQLIGVWLVCFLFGFYLSVEESQ